MVGSIAHHYGLSVSQALKKLEELLRIYPTAEYTSPFQQKPTLNAVYDKKRNVPYTENQNTGNGLKTGDTEITEIKDLYYFPLLNYIKSRKICVEDEFGRKKKSSYARVAKYLGVSIALVGRVVKKEC